MGFLTLKIFFFSFFIKVSLLEMEKIEKECQLTEISFKLQESQKNYCKLQESSSMFVQHVSLFTLTIIFWEFKM